MVQINFAQKTVDVKIVYYGPGMSGKTTNLEVVHQEAPDANRGELTTISTDGDRTLYFDYMPLSLGTVAGMKTLFQLYTVPGQVYYNSTRKLVLQGVDGIIFVADSSASMLDKNLDSLRNLEENLNEYGRSVAQVPMVIQWNKRDLPDASPVEELEKLLNPNKVPTFEAIANTGEGVFPTLKALATVVIKNVIDEAQGNPSSSPPRPSPAAAAPPPAASPTPPPGPAPREPRTVARGSVAPQELQRAASPSVTAARADASGRTPGPRPVAPLPAPTHRPSGRGRSAVSRTSPHPPARSRGRRTADPKASLPQTRSHPRRRGAPAALLIALGGGLAAGLGWLVMSLL